MILLVVASTAVLTAFLTTVLLWATSNWWLRSRIERHAAAAGDVVAGKVGRAVEQSIEEALPRLRKEVAHGVADGAEELLPRFRTEVEAGFVDAGERLLPQFREQVSAGFREAMSSAFAGGAIGKAGEELARRGGSVIDAGLDVLLGRRNEEE
jgi:hypothetical protein